MRFRITNFQTYKNIDMKQKTNKLVQFKQWILGFLIIFTSFGIFGETIMWSWQMWCEIFGGAIGGIVLI